MPTCSGQTKSTCAGKEAWLATDESPSSPYLGSHPPSIPPESQLSAHTYPSHNNWCLQANRPLLFILSLFTAPSLPVPSIQSFIEKNLHPNHNPQVLASPPLLKEPPNQPTWNFDDFHPTIHPTEPHYPKGDITNKPRWIDFDRSTQQTILFKRGTQDSQHATSHTRKS